MEGEFITIARIAKVQGRRGEVAADIHTDFPEQFAGRSRLFVCLPGGRRELHVQGHWIHKGRIVLKFQGIDEISHAEALVGAELQVPRTERVDLRGSAAYLSDLAGCLVLADNRQIGRVSAVVFGTGEAPLLVVDSDGRELLLPFAQEYLQRMDLVAKRIEMSLPEGMLDLDAPLTEEEKRQQRKQS